MRFWWILTGTTMSAWTGLSSGSTFIRPTSCWLPPLVFPAIVLMLGIAQPLGWLPADALSYERAHDLATNLAYGPNKTCSKSSKCFS